MRRIALLCIAAVAVAACADQATVAPPAPDVAFLNSPGTEDLDLPFSAAVRAGDFLFLSGAIGIDPASGELAPGGIQPETRQTLENIRASVERFGTSMDRIVKCTVFLADMNDYNALNELYRKQFKGDPPARTTVQVAKLPRDARIEIEAVAVLK